MPVDRDFCLPVKKYSQALSGNLSDGGFLAELNDSTCNALLDIVLHLDSHYSKFQRLELHLDTAVSERELKFVNWSRYCYNQLFVEEAGALFILPIWQQDAHHANPVASVPDRAAVDTILECLMRRDRDLNPVSLIKQPSVCNVHHCILGGCCYKPRAINSRANEW